MILIPIRIPVPMAALSPRQVGYGALLISRGTISVGLWVAFWAAAASMQPLLPTLSQSLQQLEQARMPLTYLRARARDPALASGSGSGTSPDSLPSHPASLRRGCTR